MYTIRHLLKLSTLSLLVYGVTPAGLQAAGTHAGMVACVQTCTDALKVCINACPEAPKVDAVKCYAPCMAAKAPTPNFSACYMKCMSDNS